MNLCSDGHDEIVYEGRHCPACDLKQERDAQIKENDELRATVKALEDNV